MTIFYSGKTLGFYDTALHGDGIPDGSVEVTEEEHAALFDGQAQGKMIVPDVKGRPMLQDPEPISLDQAFDVLSRAVDRHMDGVVKERDYTNGLDRALSWMFSADPKVAAEAQAMARWRDAVWAKFYIFKEAAAETGVYPGEAEVIAGLPAIVWPQS